jgi:hypothetical protein
MTVYSAQRYALYRVVGRRNYRGHTPGSIFEAALDPSAAQRAIQRGDLKLLKRSTPSIQPGTFRLPHGWLTEEGGK